MDKEYTENDYCDLDPKKICDNCCKCLERHDEADYSVIMADLALPDDAHIVGEDIEHELGDPMSYYEEVDPKLMAEWEEKLRAYEETIAKREAAHADEAPAQDETLAVVTLGGLKAVRKKKN